MWGSIFEFIYRDGLSCKAAFTVKPRSDSVAHYKARRRLRIGCMNQLRVRVNFPAGIHNKNSDAEFKPTA